jgi:hypothetical protein
MRTTSVTSMMRMTRMRRTMMPARMMRMSLRRKR